MPRVLLLTLLALLCAATPAQATHTAWDRPLFIPPVETDADIEIPIVEADVPILSATTETRLWTYGGTFPGPTIRRPAGEATTVTFTNSLPQAAGDLTVHRHGGHQASTEDGLPDAALGDGVYEYDLMEGGQPERAAFEWYHDHRIDLTGRNVWNGLAGMFIIDDAFEAGLPLPAGDYDVPLLIVDRSFGPEGQLQYPDPRPFEGLEGDHVLVNGLPQPYLEVEPRRYRLRLLNASNARVLTLSVARDDLAVPVDQIAAESGLLPNPVERSNLTLGPAERAEVVTDFTGREGETLVLRDATGGELLQFRVDAPLKGTDASSVPDVLRPNPDLGTSRRTREFDLSRATLDGRNVWTVGGKAYDGARVDAEPKVDTTETWTFRGGSGLHTVHLHGADFRILSRDGQPPPPWEAGLKDTFLLNKETVVIKMRFTDHQGPFVFHCHVLEHEDNGMMARFDVTAEGDALPPPDEPDPDPGPGPVDPSPTATPDPGPTPAPAALAAAWVRTPKAIEPRAAARLRIEARSVGGLATAASKLVVKGPKGIALARAKRRKLTFAVPALEPGAKKTFVVKARTGRRLPERAVFTARIGGRSARLTLRRRRGALRPAATQSLLWRL